MPSVDDFEKFLSGELSKDDLKRRLDVGASEDPLVDWDQHDRTTGMYDTQHAFNTTVGLNEDQALHDRSMGRGANVGDFESFLSGNLSAVALRAKLAQGSPLEDLQAHDRATGLYDNQRGLATTYGLDRDQLDHDIATGRFDRERTVDAPASTFDPVADMQHNDVVTGRYDSQPTTNDYSTYNTYNTYSDPTRI